MVDKKKREAARRELERKLEQRQREHAQRRQRTTRVAAISAGVIVVVIVVVIAIVASTGGKKHPVAAPTNSGARGSTLCSFLASGTAAKSVPLPPTTVTALSGTATVKVATTQGAMTFSLNRTAAPCTVASFVWLVQHHYYDKTPCHRLVTNGIYVLQCGDPLGTGAGGPGYTVPDEANGAEAYPAGTIAMARTQDPHSGGSQFFIVYKDSPNLQQGLKTLQYTIFGQVSAGLDVVTKVAAGGANPANDGKPKLPISITSMTG